MRISSKCRYGIAAMISISQSNSECVTIISISETLGISKIYLEQVFSLLKRAGLVNSLKGAQGGYQLSKSSDKILAGDIIRACEVSLFEKTERSVSDSSVEIDKALDYLVWTKLDDAVSKSIDAVTLSDLCEEVERQKNGNDLMFYI